MLCEMRNVPYVFDKNIIPDYIIGATGCLMFISVEYHMRYPKYLSRRLSELRAGPWSLRVLLCLVDTQCDRSLNEFNVLAVHSECTLILAHSYREAARLVECFKAYEHNRRSTIRERVDSDHLSKLTDALTTVKPLNKTDVVTLTRKFGSLANIFSADDFSDCPGIGDKKIESLNLVLDQPFSLEARQKRDNPPTTTSSSGPPRETSLSADDNDDDDDDDDDFVADDGS